MFSHPLDMIRIESSLVNTGLYSHGLIEFLATMAISLMEADPPLPIFKWCRFVIKNWANADVTPICDAGPWNGRSTADNYVTMAFFGHKTMLVT